MSVKIGSGIVKDGLILHLDAADPSNYVLSEVEVLVVGAGGGGGVCYGGGGGGGAVIYNNSYAVTPGSAINVTIGNGGTNRVNVVGDGGPGGNTVFGNITAPGGGYGGGNCGNVGGGGASGGGGSSNGSTNTSGGSGIIGLGYDGEASIVAGGGGGGGAGSQGYGRHGGRGLQYSISGTSQYYGGGGSGGGPEVIPGGLGGGGLSGTAIPAGGADSGGANGVANTGGGGGGSIISGSTGTSGVGGSGIVIVRYPGPQKATGGNTITTTNGYTIHTFTSSGTFTPLTTPANGGTVYGLQDLIGNNTGTQSGGVTYSTANRGSLVFDGSNDCVLLQSTTMTFNSFSLSIWFKTSQSADAKIFSNSSIYHPIQTFNGNMRVCIGGCVVGTTVINDNIWRLATVVGDGASIRLYLNNNTTPEITQSATSASVTSIPSIGKVGEGSSFYYSGNIAQVQIYNRALTTTEINQNFNALRWRFGL
jgi:hypothetical protein